MTRHGFEWIRHRSQSWRVGDHSQAWIRMDSASLAELESWRVGELESWRVGDPRASDSEKTTSLYGRAAAGLGFEHARHALHAQLRLRRRWLRRRWRRSGSRWLTRRSAALPLPAARATRALAAHVRLRTLRPRARRRGHPASTRPRAQRGRCRDPNRRRPAAVAGATHILCRARSSWACKASSPRLWASACRCPPP
jgi:hypothetical protein